MILVVGATGNVGSKLARALSERGAPVRAFVRDPSKAEAMFGGDVELVRGDLADVSSVRAAVEGVEAVFVQCSNHPQQPELEGAAIDAAAEAGIDRIVNLSTVGAEIDSPLEFWDAAGRIEQHMARSAGAGVVLRPSYYMSNVFAAAEPIKQTGKIFAPFEGARISMIDPRDVALVSAVVLTEDGHQGKTYELTGPEAIGYAEVAEALSAATGREIEFVPVPDEAARAAMLESGMPEWVVGNLVTLAGLLRGGAAQGVNDSVARLTGREPRSFAEFARDNAAAFA